MNLRPCHRALSCVLWDLDGTLVDSEPLYFKAISQICAEHGADLGWDDYLRWVGESDRAVWRKLRRRHQIPLTCAQFTDAVAQRYCRMLKNLKCRPGVQDVVATLSARGIPQAVVSNAARSVVMANLRTVGLGQAFAFAVCGDDVRNHKPHPEPYVTAMRRLGRAPDECLVIEDSEVGVRSGCSAGATVVTWSSLHHAPNWGAALIVTRIADILDHEFRT